MPYDQVPGTFVAREQERKQVLGAVLARKGAAVVGPAGVGRTALLTAVAAQLGVSRFEVVWTAATEASRQVPFGVFRALLGVGGRLDHGQAYGLLRTELARRAGRRIPVLVIDDVHHLDDASAALTLSLAGDGNPRLVVSAQSGLPASDAVVALWKDSYLERFDIAPFGLADTGRLVHALMEGAAARPTVDLLHQWTGGNPLFLTELVRHGRATRRLVSAGGLWWWRGPLSVPPRLAELFERELRGLDPRHQDALAAVALGEPLALPVLEAVAPDVVESLEEQGLLCTLETGGQILVRLGQPMLGAALRHRLPRLRRRRLAVALLGACTPGGPDPVTRARWQLDAHGPVDSALLIRAAETVCRQDPELACRFARRALERSSAAAVPLAHALVELGDAAQARKVLERTREAATTPSGRLRLSTALAAHRCWADRDPAGAADELVALRAEATVPTAQAALDGVHALVLLFGGRTGAAGRLAERVLYEASHGPGVAAARLALAASLALTGRTADAVTLAEDPSPDRALPSYLPDLAPSLRAFAQLWPASDLRRPVGRRAVQGVPPGGEGALLGGYLQWVRGRRTDAMARLREAVVQQAGGPRLFLTEASSWLAVCLAEEQRPDCAEQAIAPCWADRVGVVPGQVHRAAAVIAAARGDTAGAAVAMWAAVDAAREAGCWAVEAEYLTYAAWLGPAGPPPAVLDRLAEVVRHVDAPRLVTGAEAVLALARGTGTELLDHAVRLEALGLSAQAWRLAERAAATLQQQGGSRRGDAVVLVGRLRERLGVAPPPAQPVALTTREVEIASLAAGGLSDRAISHRLAVSVRTVESHLTRIYRKLGVHSRRDLPPVLRG
ncbi:LuxR C-terminal-related transcriptional regulator [Streptomyces sp. TLI_146]|uniref:LuxR C-terminal-related transcriptional regulator n=1 Tax=Streptomyces sp. TLI_146 TaxID=1938858 RepID=UPI00117C56BF|nr:LuxR C-terminal-related transcriptional regulator [Streptomyces sp. TLI_146]